MLFSCSLDDFLSDDDKTKDEEKQKLELDLKLEDQTFVYDGLSHSLQVEGEVPDFVIVSYEGNEKIDVGAYQVTATIESHSDAYEEYKKTLSATLTIIKADYDLSELQFNDAEIEYDGLSHSIEIEGTLPDGLSVIYTGNEQTNVGEYEVVASFQNTNPNYNDINETLAATLRIIKPRYVLENVHFDDVELDYDGDVHAICIDGDLPESVSVVYENNEQINAGTYEVKAIFSIEDDNYSAPETLSATLTINRLTYDMAGIQFNDIELDYDGEMHYIYIEGDLPEGVSVTYENNGKTKPGTYEVIAEFIGDPLNYNDIEDMVATITINRTEEQTNLYGDDVFYIDISGEYTVTGEYKQILVELAEDDLEEVVINLSGATITNDSECPVYINVANGGVSISAKNKTENFIIDKRPLSLEEEQEAGGAIYATCDLELKGKGTLTVESTYNNGIHSKDDLKIKNLTLTVKAPHNALKGNDSVKILSGNITVISTGGDGIKTTNSDISSKGNQKGSVLINGGTVTIYAACDGIDAAYDVVIEETDVEVPVVLNVYTSKHSEYTGEIYQSSSSNKYYLRVSSSYRNYRFGVYLYDNDGGSVFVTPSYETSYYNSYYYSFEAPTGYNNYILYASSSSTVSTTNYSAKTSGNTLNTSNNCLYISRIQSSSIQTSWTNYTTSGTSYSAKGIKADNEITVLSGSVVVKASDDGLHANNDQTLENGSVGKGNITISGGTLDITSGDDGVHADSYLTINEGQITTNAYEGLEADYIVINGGTIYSVAGDDGINASRAITVNGGYVDVTVGSGDVDGIDSNGTYTQTGGFVISRISTNDTSGNMAALDCDGTITFSGGTFVALGTTSSRYTTSIPYIKWGSSGMGGFPGGGGPGGYNPWGGSSGQSSGSSISIGAGTYTVSNTTIEFKAASSYSALFIVSDQFTSGQSYTIYKGETSVASQNATK